MLRLMPTPLEGEGPLYLPTRADPAINQLFENVSPRPGCGAAQQSLGQSRARSSEAFTLSCATAGHIGGDGSSVAVLVTNDKAFSSVADLAKTVNWATDLGPLHSKA
jgi:hypothetical protein